MAKSNILNVFRIPWFRDDIDLPAQTELHTYLSSVGELGATSHPADLWSAAAQQFPKLSDIALMRLNVPCNSVAAERSFSLYSEVFRDDRRYTKGESLEMYSTPYQTSGKLCTVQAALAK